MPSALQVWHALQIPTQQRMGAVSAVVGGSIFGNDRLCACSNSRTRLMRQLIHVQDGWTPASVWSKANYQY